jgi:hypothetical protein
MPYIKPEYREELQPELEELIQVVKDITPIEPSNIKDGILNYIFTKMLIELYPNPRYKDFNEMIGILECCKLELYRKKAAPYENEKELENGSV